MKSAQNGCNGDEFPRLGAIGCFRDRPIWKYSSRSRNTPELLSLSPAKKDLNSTATLFPFLEKTKIKLKDDYRQGRTVRDRNRQESTRTLKKVPHSATNTDTERQEATARCLAPKRQVGGSTPLRDTKSPKAEFAFGLFRFSDSLAAFQMFDCAD